jgi:hypothetical protein
MSASFLKRLQRDSYLISRAAGDADAARRGPAVLAKRIARRKATRLAYQLLRRTSR